MSLSTNATTLACIVTALLATSVAAAEPTPSELAALAASPDLKRIDLPFLEAPEPDLSRFVTMSDGTRLAISLYLPPGFDLASDKAAAVFEDSVYGRREDASTTAIRLYTAAGYVVVIGDARGFAASFGAQAGFNTPQQTADEGDVIDWIAAQPWSNGKVAAIGHSVSGVFADSMTASGAEPLKAAIIRSFEFDEYLHNMFPGGAPNLGILALAEELMAWHGGGDCAADVTACANLGFMPVDGDAGFELLQQAIRDHQGNVAGTAFASVVYRDDVIGTAAIAGSGGMSRLDAIRDARVPARVSASWVDGLTALSALTRFVMAPDLPMEVVIGATTHPGGLDADPYSRIPFAPAIPSAEEQFAGDVSFVDRVMAGEAIGRSITYVVLGTDAWKTTETWPPIDVGAHRFSLAPSALMEGESGPATATYAVDPTSTSGAYNRWAAQRGGVIFYGDRRDAAGKRMTFDGMPLTEDQELVGTPALCLAMSTDQPDGLVIAYLEDVAPDGRVTYLTEGILRLIHRGATGCENGEAAGRTFNKADGAPVTPGALMRFELELLPVAALVRKGHHLRLSLAGADAGWFNPLTEQPATWTVHFGQDASSLSIPMRAWTE